jgi:hypothetical protein
VRKSAWNSPSFRPTIFPRAKTGRVCPASGPNGSTKELPSLSASEQGLRNVSDADAYRSTDAGLPIQPIEPDAADPGRGTGWVEIADRDGSAKGTTAKGEREHERREAEPRPELRPVIFSQCRRNVVSSVVSCEQSHIPGRQARAIGPPLKPIAPATLDQQSMSKMPSILRHVRDTVLLDSS